MRIPWMIGLKGLALGSGLLNVLVVAIFLDPDDGYFFLTTLSIAQLLLAFSGFGLSHRLVELDTNQMAELKTWPWFLGTILLGWCAFMAFYWSVPTTQGALSILVLASLLLVQLIFSEWVRVSFSLQIGFVTYNLALLMCSLLLTLFGGPTWLIVLPPLIGLGFTLRRYATPFFSGSYNSRPLLGDIARALRVMVVNQFYHLMVLVFAVAAGGSDVLVIVLVYRFAILFNWPNFFWLRFGHRSLAQGVTDAHHEANRKYILVNLGFGGATLFVLWMSIWSGLLDLFPGQLDLEFALVLSCFATLRLLTSLIFPYEVFLIYGVRAKLGCQILLAAGASVLSVGAVIHWANSPFVIIAVVELVWITWRLAARSLCRRIY